MKRVMYRDIFSADNEAGSCRGFMCYDFNDKIIKNKKIIINIKDNPEYESENGFSEFEIFFYCLKAVSVGGDDITLLGFEYNDEGFIYPIISL